MSFFAYLKDRLTSLCLFAVTALFVFIFCRAYHIPLAATLTIIGLFALAALSTCIITYLSRKSFYSELDRISHDLDQSHLIAEIIKEPAFYEGYLTYQALRSAGKSMNDQIARYRNETKEYREFIELWVHEVKSPLATAKLAAQNAPLDISSTLSSQLSRIHTAVDVALYYARSRDVEADYLIAPTTLQSCVSEALKLHARTLIDARLTPKLIDLEVKVYADKKWLTFIIGQIIINAAKYVKPDGGILHIASSTHKTGNHTHIVDLTITDSGIGIPPEDLPRIFERGFTGKNGREYHASTGMGLYLCKTLCERMGLSIDATSQEGVSTTITIHFPLQTLRF